MGAWKLQRRGYEASGVTQAEFDGRPAFGVEGADVADALVNFWLKILMCASLNGSVENVEEGVA